MDFLEILFPILPMCGLLLLVLFIGVAVNYFWLKFMYRRILACPECNAKGAGEVIDTQEVILSNKVDYKLRKPVRIKETKITDHYQCKVCGHSWTRSFTQKERVRIDSVTQK
jgi:transcription elongation factor Elf1